MQFATLLALAVGASAAAITSPRQAEVGGTVTIFSDNTSCDDAAATETYDLPADMSCVDKSSDFVAASFVLAPEAKDLLLAAFSGPACTGDVRVMGPGMCLVDINSSEGFRSVRLIQDPTGTPPGQKA